MIVDDLDFFETILEDDFIKFYITLSNQEVMNEIDKFELNYAILLIESFLDNSIKLNRRDKLIFLYNMLVYIVSIAIYFDRDVLMEDNLKWSFKQIKEECEILKLLRKAFLYSLKNMSDITCDNISMIILLLSILNKERDERVNLEKNNLTLLSSKYNNFSVEFFSDYDSEKLKFMLAKIKSYAKGLKK